MITSGSGSDQNTCPDPIKIPRSESYKITRILPNHPDSDLGKYPDPELSKNPDPDLTKYPDENLTKITRSGSDKKKRGSKSYRKTRIRPKHLDPNLTKCPLPDPIKIPGSGFATLTYQENCTKWRIRHQIAFCMLYSYQVATL